jgi:hypothetical protein
MPNPRRGDRFDLAVAFGQVVRNEHDLVTVYDDLA